MDNKESLMKISLTKESWAALSDDEKTKELQQLFPTADYKKIKEEYERLHEWSKEMNIGGSMFPTWKSPVLHLTLIDPVMTHTLMNWMYTQGEKLSQVPWFGYRLDTIDFAEVALSDNERHVIEEAQRIIARKFGLNHE